MELTELVHSESYPVMPDFAGHTAEFSHSVDSALQVLDSLGFAESRLTLQMAGPGQAALQVVRQSPRPGTPLAPSLNITLWISGFGFFDALPMPMRESGGEAEMGTRELCRLFDDPLQKAAQWFRAGSPLFKIGPDKHAACRRWIGLFGIDSSKWPQERLYPLAQLAPTLARMAGREVGVRLALLVLLGLPLHKLLYHDSYRLLPAQQQSLLGAQACRLGRDFIAGDRQIDIDSITLQIGPVSLETYRFFQTESGRGLIQMVVDLCSSAYQSYSVAWILEDALRMPHLGIATDNSSLGLNFHLGKGGRG
jgi:hypothetical protein